MRVFAFEGLKVLEKEFPKIISLATIKIPSVIFLRKLVFKAFLEFHLLA